MKQAFKLFKLPVRNFSTSRAMAQEYNVIVFDKPNALEARLRIRPSHVGDIKKNVDAGIITAAGPIFKDEAKTVFAGSSLNVVRESREDVIEFLKTDIYYREGVWDVENAIINPITLAVRIPHVLDGTNTDLYKL